MSLLLVVGGVAEVWSLAVDGWASTVVSAADCGAADEDLPVPAAAARRLVLRFRDTSDAADPEGFSAALADEFVAFTAATGKARRERVVVHCTYGISRSPALALGLLVAAGHDPDRAFEHLFRVRPQAQPNALVVERLDAATGSDGALWRVFETWARQQAWWPYQGRRWLADAEPEERLAALEPMVRRRLTMERPGRLSSEGPGPVGRRGIPEQ